MKTVRIFFSSPSDVAEERTIAHRVVRRLQVEFAGVFRFETVIWEREPLLATAGFQEQIERPADADIFVAMLWSRLGTPLSGNFVRDDGTRFRSGTEFEFEVRKIDLVLDGGPSSRPGAGRDAVPAALRRRGARQVALMALSHPDLDHIGGLEAVMAEFRVGAVLDSGAPLPRAGYARLVAVASEKEIPWLRAHDGVRLRIDEIEILVLGPGSPDSDADPQRRTSSNETSLLLRIAAGDFRYVTSGDATAEEELRALSAWPAESLRADVLKIGHHGSRTSSAAAWLEAVQPKVAIISVGAGNRFGHPHPEVVQRIERAGITDVWRTDLRGTLCIEIRSDGSWRMAGQAAWNRAAAAALESRHED